MKTSLEPLLFVRVSNPSEKEQVRCILEEYGRSSMASFALLDDKTYYFSLGGSVIAYTVMDRVAVVMGDPIGPPEDISACIAEFQTYCANNKWLLTFCLTQPDYLPQYRQAGFHALSLGAEALIDLDAFDLHGRANSSFRKRYHRFLKQGYKFELLEPPISNDQLRELRAISEDWISQFSGEEKRFFLGWFYDDYIRRSPVAIVRTPGGQISAFANLVPEFQLNEISMDLVRYRNDSISGTIDFLAVSLFNWAREQGYETFNLGLSALSEVGTQPEANFIERVIHFIYEHGNSFYSFKGLYEFKRKFHPRWVSQYMIYPSWATLIPVSIAIAKVSAGEAVTFKSPPV